MMLISEGKSIIIKDCLVLFDNSLYSIIQVESLYPSLIVVLILGISVFPHRIKGYTCMDLFLC